MRQCARCKKPSEKYRCQACAEFHRQKSNQRVADRKTKGLCLVCGGPRDDSRSTCEACRTKYWNRETKTLQEKRFRDKRKLEAFIAYGGFICKCCGETEKLFLTIDHVNNDGANHRREIGKGRKANASGPIYAWLRKNKYPEGFQVLCINCNFGKRMNKGVCPHQEALVWPKRIN